MVLETFTGLCAYDNDREDKQIVRKINNACWNEAID